MLQKMPALKVGYIVVSQFVITIINVENFSSINGAIAFLFTLHCTNPFIITLLLVNYDRKIVKRAVNLQASIHSSPSFHCHGKAVEEHTRI